MELAYSASLTHINHHIKSLCTFIFFSIARLEAWICSIVSACNAISSCNLVCNSDWKPLFHSSNHNQFWTLLIFFRGPFACGAICKCRALYVYVQPSQLTFGKLVWQKGSSARGYEERHGLILGGWVTCVREQVNPHLTPFVSPSELLP